MAVNVRNSFLATKPVKNPMPGVRADFQQMYLTTAQLVTTNIFVLAMLPAMCRLAALRVETDQLDSNGTPLITFNLGLLNTYNSVGDASAGNVGWDTGTSPAIVTTVPAGIYNVTGGKATTLLISANATAKTGGWCGPDATTQPANAWGVDMKNDRLVAMQLQAAPATAQAGYFGIHLMFDYGLPGSPASQIPASD